MARFHYRVVAEAIHADVDANFTTDLEYKVDDIVWLGRRRYVVERIEDAGGAHWVEELGEIVVSRHLQCRLCS
jgi:hypothetical protein